ncbi:multicopper oxidase [Devosia pacifica]|jgi:FtsP/CotA-like multicopper oxidase with cupredoxin domain|uniref:Multicopper oxidase n=1 Tax=Devosia pacifica TaxID=1335967 RepID=A0A918S979_9HYPH|nr:multicopper oxidase family protein [Devosia pacifica]GHA27501.1 multicopper oxidase [Devosia pacifica]
MAPLSRRSFLASGAAAGIMASLPGTVYAQASTKANAFTLRAVRRTIEVDGRAASVLGLVDGSGRPGLILDPGQRFRVDLTNDLDVETIVHWHGQIPPNAQDGVSNTSPMIPAGGSRSFDFAPRTGTFWMHSHVPAQEVDQLAAPLIVRSAEDLAADRQEVVLFLHDFSFRSGEEVLEEITSGRAMPHGEVQEGSHSMGEFPRRIVGHHESDPMSMPMPNAMSGGMAGMGHDSGMEMDLNDFEFDAYLANDRTLDDPEVIAVERGGRVLLRAINAASMTAFWIDLGSVVGRLVAVDGDAVEPMEGTRFGFAQGQRLDIEIDMPADGSVLPVLALREGAPQRTGIVLAPRGAEVRRISSTADAEHPAYSGDMTTELALRALNPLPDRPVDRTHMVMLGGQMSPYVWSLNGQLWGSHTPVAVMSGERVEMMFHNMSMMAHPMHLHGHAFQVVDVNGQRIAGAVRDTVHVPPMGMVTIAFDAGEVAPWMLHCHHMAHMAAGMMSELDVRSA